MTQGLADNTSFRIHCTKCGNEVFIIWENLRTKDHVHCPFCGVVAISAHLPAGEGRLVVDFSNLDLDDLIRHPEQTESGDVHRLGTLEIESV